MYFKRTIQYMKEIGDTNATHASAVCNKKCGLLFDGPAKSAKRAAQGHEILPTNRGHEVTVTYYDLANKQTPSQESL
jgi:hypothetical protein